MVDEPAQTTASPFPRWSLGALEALHAAALAAAAGVLPIHTWTVFALACYAQAALHAAAATLALAAHPRRALAWRIQSFGSLALLAGLTVALLRSGIYVAQVYGGLGRGVAAVVAAGWGLVVLFTVPLACWGLAATGGIRWPTRPRAPPVLGVVALGLAIASVVHARASAAVEAAPTPGASETHVDGDLALAGALAPAAEAWQSLPSAADPAPPLLVRAPVECGAPPGPARPTWVVTYVARSEDGRVAPRSRCLQPAGAGELGATLAAALREDGVRAPVVVVQIEGVQSIPALAPAFEAVALRPGLDGVCLGARCLMPWQLVAGGQFGVYRPLPRTPDVHYGIRAEGVRRALDDSSTEATLRGLLRVIARTAIIDGRGELHALERLRLRDPPGAVTEGPRLAAGIRAAEEFVLAAQLPDGRFLYTLEPFTGASSFEGFAVSRQAGTTAALCEVGGSGDRMKIAAASSIKMLASLEWRSGDLGALIYPRGDVSQPIKLGPSALGLVAVLSCRQHLGRRTDDLAGRLGRFLLTMQKPDGSFYPFLDRVSARPVPGPAPMYAEGEAVYALVLLEREAARQRSSRLPEVTVIEDAVSRAMDHFGQRYWNHLERDLFFLEESWHCIAARAALGHHRNLAYEKLCLDYVASKSRFVLGDHSGVAPELVGGLGFGNVVPPESTPTASFGEAVAAAIELRRARGEDAAAERATLARMLAFLLRQQWDETSCFACATSPRIPGAFSEQIAVPTIRIDYVQHAWSALAHGARALAGEGER